MGLKNLSGCNRAIPIVGCILIYAVNRSCKKSWGGRNGCVLAVSPGPAVSSISHPSRWASSKGPKEKSLSSQPMTEAQSNAKRRRIEPQIQDPNQLRVPLRGKLLARFGHLQRPQTGPNGAPGGPRDSTLDPPPRVENPPLHLRPPP